MSWHAGDWGNFSVSLVSAAATVVAAWMAVGATKAALKSAEESRNNAILENENKEYDRAFGIVLQLIDRANSTIDHDAHVKEDIGQVVEFVSAINAAFAILNSSKIPPTLKIELVDKIKRLLRPGAIGELENLDAYLAVNGEKYADLEAAYLEAIKSLGLQQKTLLPTQSTNLFTT